MKIALRNRNVPLGPFDNLEMQPVTIVECGSFGLGSPEQTGEKLDPRYTAKPGAGRGYNRVCSVEVTAPMMHKNTFPHEFFYPHVSHTLL